jgi:RimJ/RimL family protein N-acetyltransferase
MNKFEIQTERTVLRRFREEDLDDIASVLAHPEVMKFSLSGPYSREQSRSFIERCLSGYEKRNIGLYAVIYRENQKVIGYCGFSFQDIDGVEEVEIGYRLHRDYWNRGLATETAKAIQDTGFKKMGFERMISIIEAENIGSIRVAEKNGMIFEKAAIFKNTIPVRIYSASC